MATDTIPQRCCHGHSCTSTMTKSSLCNMFPKLSYVIFRKNDKTYFKTYKIRRHVSLQTIARRCYDILPSNKFSLCCLLLTLTQRGTRWHDPGKVRERCEPPTLSHRWSYGNHWHGTWSGPFFTEFVQRTEEPEGKAHGRLGDARAIISVEISRIDCPSPNRQPSFSLSERAQ